MRFGIATDHGGFALKEELDTAFFSGLDSEAIADVPEPQSLRPCCIFGNDVGVQVGSVPVPGYEVRNVLDLNELGTHQYNKGTLSMQPGGGLAAACLGGRQGDEQMQPPAGAGMIRTAATGGPNER